MFEKIIGYENEKAELAKFCDVIININYYKSLGISIPKGILLYGAPGLGKTTFAYSIIEACNVPHYVLRKNADTSQFIENIIEVFTTASKNAPSIVLLDDMDKYGNGDKYSPEYTSLQGALDTFKTHDIFVIATVNEIFALPPSLIRSGRFDQVIRINNPKDEESSMITNYYLDIKNINLDPTINRALVGRLLNGCSCATIETVVNMAAIYSVYERAPYITIQHMLDAVLNIVYDRPRVARDSRTPEERYMLAIHEAGKAVVTYYLRPDLLSFITIRERNNSFNKNNDTISTNGINSKLLDNLGVNFIDMLKSICILVGGKTCYEMKFGTYSTYADEDSHMSSLLIEDIMYSMGNSTIPSVITMYDNDTIIGKHGEIIPPDMNKPNFTDRKSIYEYCINCCRDILLRNWSMVESIANLLMERDTITIDDIYNLTRVGYSGNGMFRNLIQN